MAVKKKLKLKHGHTSPAESTNDAAKAPEASRSDKVKKKVKIQDDPHTDSKDESSDDAPTVEIEVDDKKKKKRKAGQLASNEPSETQADKSPVDEAAARAAREEAAYQKRNADDKRKAQNRDLRERYQDDPSSLSKEETVRAKQLMKVYEATEAARKKIADRTVEGEEGPYVGSNETKRKRQAEIAEVRSQIKMGKKPKSEPAEASEPSKQREGEPKLKDSEIVAAAFRRGGLRGRGSNSSPAGRGSSSGRGRLLPTENRGTPSILSAGEVARGNGRGRSGRGGSLGASGEGRGSFRGRGTGL